VFTRIPIPTPFQVGAVNTYLAGRTLVDPGPDSTEAWSHLVDALEERDLHPDDVERVLITHPHPDHFGLAHRFSDRGATIVASPEAADIMADFPGRFEYERSFFRDFFERCGMADSTAETVTDLPEAFLRYGPSVRTDREVEGDDALAVQTTTLTVDEVAGHAAGELLFHFEVDGKPQAIVGDHVLAEITPNPFLLPPPDAGADRPRVLPAYNRSLERLERKALDRLLPGHRTIIEAPSTRIAETLAAHDERSSEVESLVDGPTTPLDVMEGLFGDLPVTEYFPGMSEAVGHLDVLEGRGIVQARDRGGMLVYEPT